MDMRLIFCSCLMGFKCSLQILLLESTDAKTRHRTARVRFSSVYMVTFVYVFWKGIFMHIQTKKGVGILPNRRNCVFLPFSNLLYVEFSFAMRVIQSVRNG